MSAPTARSTQTTILRDLAFLLIVGFVLYFVGMGRLDLKHEEPRRALVAQEMIASGEYLLPHLNGQPYLAKPPLFNWLIIAASWLTGEVNETAARLPSALSVLGVAMLLYFWARTGISRRAGFLSALIVMTTGLFLEKGPMAEIDMNFTFWVTGSLLFLYRAFVAASSKFDLPLAYAFLAAAFLAKGPPALLFFGGALAALIWQNRSLSPLIRLSHGAGIALFIFPIALWLWVIDQRIGIGALVDTAYVETVEKGSVDSPLNPLSWFFYPVSVLTSLLPWSLFLLLAIPAWKIDPSSDRTRLMRFCLLTTLAAVVLFSFSGAKSARYLLPIIPCMAMLIADVLDRMFDRKLSEEWLRRGHIITKLVAGIMLLGAVALGVIVVADWEAPLIAGVLVGAIAMAVACACWIGISRNKPLALPVAIALIACIYRVSYVTWYAPDSNARYSIAHVSEPLSQRMDADTRLYTLSYTDYGLHYYIGRHVQRLLSLDELADKGEAEDNLLLLLNPTEAADLIALRPGQWSEAFSYTHHKRDIIVLEETRDSD